MILISLAIITIITLNLMFFKIKHLYNFEDRRFFLSLLIILNIYCFTLAFIYYLFL